MRYRKAWWVVVLLIGVSVPLLAASAGHRSSGGPATVRGHGQALPDFVQHLSVLPGVTHKNLTIFPVTAIGARVPGVAMTLDTAGAKGLIDVSELKESEVNRLVLINRAKEPVFVMAGEMVRGGRQDRIMADDLVLAPGASAKVAVFCVEHGRWVTREEGVHFSTGHSVAGARAREAGGTEGQTGVWDAVATQQRALKAPSPTGALRSVHDSESVRRQIGSYLKAFADLPKQYPKASGIVAVVDGEILAADLFSSTALFAQSWPELLEAYAIDAVEHAEGYRGGRRHATPGVREIRHWLEGMTSAARTEKHTPGEGESFELRSRSLRGAGLEWQGGVVHVGLFPASEVETPKYDPLQFRRDRLQGR